MLRNVAEKWTSHREGEAQQGDGHYQKESNASRNNKVSKLNFFHFLFWFDIKSWAEKEFVIFMLSLEITEITEHGKNTEYNI
jgi:hypothetical protein